MAPENLGSPNRLRQGSGESAEAGGNPAAKAEGASSDLRDDLARRVDAIEAGYEFTLAYAAQGLTTDVGAASGEQIREFLRRFDAALTGLADQYRAVVADEGLGPTETYHAFVDVLARDATATQAVVRLVLAQAGISSQLVDNLNASIHVRALLTDIFLIDELLKR